MIHTHILFHKSIENPSCQIVIAGKIIVKTIWWPGAIWKGKCTTMKMDEVNIRKIITSLLRHSTLQQTRKYTLSKPCRLTYPSSWNCGKGNITLSFLAIVDLQCTLSVHREEGKQYTLQYMCTYYTLNSKDSLTYTFKGTSRVAK